MNKKGILRYIKDNKIEFVDLRFTDTCGNSQHITLTSESVDESLFTEGKPFDGSSIVGWQGIEASDMLLFPDEASMVVDPFRKHSTIILRCTVHDPRKKAPYEFGPRATALRAEKYMSDIGIGDTAYFGPESEFFVFDKVSFDITTNGCSYRVDSDEAVWNTGETGNQSGYNLGLKRGYFPVPPKDSCTDIRSDICIALKEMGIKVEVHHHEVATGGQSEIGTVFAPLVQKADELQLIKYVAQSIAKEQGKTITFMPKPIPNDNGNGLHVHQSIFKNNQNVFAGDEYAGLSQEALYYIGGIIKHGRALNAFTNASVNSYRRLVPGFEAPIYLSYSSQNRSAAIRIPYTPNPKGMRIEVRFPDAMMNPYLAFAAMLMAGLDGIENKIDPGEAIDKNLYALSKEETKDIPSVSYSLENALEHLDNDHEFLLKGEVFTQRQIEKYIEIKMEEVARTKTCTHPIEFEMYYAH